MKKVMLISGLFVLAMGSSQGNELQFTELDSNLDGKINKAEASVDEKLLQQFDSVDLNQDGELSQEEFQPVIKQQVSAIN